MTETTEETKTDIDVNRVILVGTLLTDPDQSMIR